MEEGREPVNKLVPRCRKVKRVRDPMERGNEPFSKLLIIARNFNSTRDPIEKGRDPVNELPRSSTPVKAVKDPTEDGNVPTKPLLGSDMPVITPPPSHVTPVREHLFVPHPHPVTDRDAIFVEAMKSHRKESSTDP
jgi:hypothetical protein